MKNAQIAPPTDLARLEHYAQSGATDAELADLAGLTEKQLRRRYRRQLRQWRAAGRCYLRAAQFKTALKGNAPMLTWLGKHELQQGEQETTIAEPVKTYIGIDLDAV